MRPCNLQVAAAQPPKFDEPVIEKKAEDLVAEQVRFRLLSIYGVALPVVYTSYLVSSYLIPINFI